MGEALSAGIEVKDYDRTLSNLIKDQGLKMRNGVIYTPPMPLIASSLSILLVANASQEASRWMYDHVKVKRTRDFKAMLAEFLKKRFEERVHHETLVGNSNKAHKFANVIDLGQARKLIIDPVANEASSINARVVANMDVKAIGNPNIVQRIIYDDEEDWSPSDLNLLGAGAIVVPFSCAGAVIERLAHAA